MLGIRDRFDGVDMELFILKVIKYVFLAMGIFGIVLLIMASIDWKVLPDGSFSLFVDTSEDVEHDKADALYFIVIGFNTFSLMNYLGGVISSRNMGRVREASLRHELAITRNNYNDSINRSNMESQVYNNIKDLKFDQLVNYHPRDRINIAYLKLRWMDKMGVENSRNFGNKFRQQLILQIRLDEKELGFTKLLINPYSYDMDALDIDFERMTWSTVQVPKPKTLKPQLRNPKNRVSFLRKLGKTSRDKRERNVYK